MLSKQIELNMATTALDNANGLETGQKTQPQPNEPAQQHGMMSDVIGILMYSATVVLIS